MKQLKNIYYNACSILPTKLVRKLSGSQPLLPYHHVVSDDHLKHIIHIYPYKNVRQFTTDLDHLLYHLKPVSVEQVVDHFHYGKKISSGGFLFSFDDGFREVYDVIAPILKRKGVPAVFFINPAFLDNKELFYRNKISLIIDALLAKKDSPVLEKVNEIPELRSDNLYAAVQKLLTVTQLEKHLLDILAKKLDISFEEYLNKQKPYMTMQQVSELAASGFTIGSHSWDHPYYKLLDLDAQKKQTIDSAEFVRRTFHPHVNVFSFPHSDAEISQDFFDQMKKEYPAIDLYFGIQNQMLESKNKMVHRFNAERPDVPMHKQLNGIMLMMMLKKVMNRQSIKRMYA